MAESVEERLIRIETKLEQVLDKMKHIDKQKMSNLKYD
jgi:hypothetical protein